MSVASLRDAFITLASIDRSSPDEVHLAYNAMLKALQAANLDIRELGKICVQHVEQELEASRKRSEEVGFASQSLGREIPYWLSDEILDRFDVNDLESLRGLLDNWCRKGFFSHRQADFLGILLQRVGVNLCCEDFVGHAHNEGEQRVLKKWLRERSFPNAVADSLAILADNYAPNHRFDFFGLTLREAVELEAARAGINRRISGNDVWRAMAGRGDPALRNIVYALLNLDPRECLPSTKDHSTSENARRKATSRRFGILEKVRQGSGPFELDGEQQAH